MKINSVMKKWWVIFISASIVFQCQRDKNYDPDSMLSAHKKDEIMMKLIRYVTRAPENVKDTEKFDSKYDAYYQQRASQCRLEQYYIDGERHFFLLSQPAPSLVEKRHATGGKMVLDEAGNLIEYEEIFRTWKMVPDTLKKRSFLLFDKMVKGEMLDPYLTKNSNIEYIEFPDDHAYYDKVSRVWRTRE
jgi:hypothetical protein